MEVNLMRWHVRGLSESTASFCWFCEHGEEFILEPKDQSKKVVIKNNEEASSNKKIDEILRFRFQLLEKSNNTE